MSVGEREGSEEEGRRGGGEEGRGGEEEGRRGGGEERGRRGAGESRTTFLRFAGRATGVALEGC